MLHSILSLRWVTLVAALGAALGAMLMFFEGCLKLAYALEMVVQPSADTETSVIATVMQGRDARYLGDARETDCHCVDCGSPSSDWYHAPE